MGKPSYDKRKQTTGVGGQFNEIKLSMLFLILGLEAFKNKTIDCFHLGSNVFCADDFDDIVFKRQKDDKVKIDLIQAKNKDSPDKKNITLEKLFSDSMEKDYNLKFYLNSFLRIVDHFTQTCDEVLKGSFDACRFIFFTNSRYNQVQGKKYKTVALPVDEILDFNSSTTGKFMIELSEDVYDSLKYPIKFLELVDEIVRLICYNIPIDLKKAIYKRFYSYLKRNVFNKEGKAVSFKQQFIIGKTSAGEALPNELDTLRREVFKRVESSNDLKKQLKVQKKIIEHDMIMKHMESKNMQFYMDYNEEFDFPQDNLEIELDRKYIDSFIKNLYIYFNQPGEEKLDDIIKGKMKSLYNLSDSDTELIYCAVYCKVQHWWKSGFYEENVFKSSYLTEKDDWFAECKANISELRLVGASLLIRSEASKLGLKFKKEALFVMSKYIDEHRVIMIKVKKETRLLTGAKLSQTLEIWSSSDSDEKKYIFLTSQELVSLKQDVIDAFQGTNNMLIVELIDQFHALNDFKEILKQHSRKKVILLVETEFDHDLCSSSERCFLDESHISMDQLSEDSQANVLDKQIIFQGDLMRLDAILPRELESLISGEVLIDLLCGRSISLGCPLQNLGNVGEYYIERKLTRQVQVGQEIFKSRQDRIAISGLTRNDFESFYSYTGSVFDFNHSKFEPNIDKNTASYSIFILRTESAGEDYRKVIDHYKDNPTHWLEYGKSNLEWKTSHGGLGNLKKHLIKNQIDCRPDEVSHVHNKVAIVAGEPGMGKSTLLSSLASTKINCTELSWRARINLLDHYDQLGSIEAKPTAYESFICDSLKLDEPWKKQLFRHYYNTKGHIILLFDGFDEISPDCKRKVLALLTTLLEMSKVEKIWITTRQYVLDDLENEMSSLAYRLQPFTEHDGVEFLLRFWKIRTADYAVAKGIITEFLAEFSTLIHDTIIEFIGIPLQLKMLAEIYEESFKEHHSMVNEGKCIDAKSIFGSNELNIYVLYKEFLKKKYYDVLITEKEKINAKHPIHEKTIKGGFSMFKSDHEKLAILALFDNELQSQLLTKKEINNIQKDMQAINAGKEKTGLIDRVVDGKPIFVHRTYAEFFFGTRLIRMLENDQNREGIASFLLKIEIFSSHRFVVRSFFDFAAIDDENTDVCSAQHTFLNAVVTNNTNRVSDMLDTDASLATCRDKAGRTPLHLAASYGHCFLAELLIKNNADVSLTDEVFGWSAISYADKCGEWDVVNLLLEHGAETDDMHEAMKAAREYKLADGDENLLHVSAFKGLCELAKALIKANPATVNAQDRRRFNKTPLHHASREGQVDMLNLLLSRGANANARDDDGWTPLHDAVHHGQLLSVIELIRLRPKSVNAVDKLKRTPLHLASETGHAGIVETLLKNGANVDARSNLAYGSDTMRSSKWTPLHVACYRGHRKTVKLLLRHGARTDLRNEPSGQTPLDLSINNPELIDMLAPNDKVLIENKFHHAVKMNDLVAVEAYLKATLDTDNLVNSMVMNWSPLHQAAFGGFEDMTRLLLKYGATVDHRRTDGFTPLHAASSHDQLGVAKILMENGADPLTANNDGWTSLHGAAQNGSMDILSYYLSEEFSERKWIDVVDLKGDSLLHAAAFHGKKEAVALLLEKKANHEVVDMIGATIAMSATITHRINILKMLIEKGVKIDSDDKKSLVGIMEFSVLHLLAAYDDVETTDYLIKDKGLHIDVGSSIGVTPLYIATLFNSQAVIDYLIKEGANVNVYINVGKVVSNAEEVVQNHKQMKTILHGPLKKYVRYFKIFLKRLPKITPVVLYKGLGYRDNKVFEEMYLKLGSWDRFKVQVIRLLFQVEFIRKQLENCHKMIRQYKTGESVDIDADFIPFESGWKPTIHRYVIFFYIITAVSMCLLLYRLLVRNEIL